MELWIIIPLFILFLAVAGTNFELLRLKKQLEIISQTKTKKKK